MASRHSICQFGVNLTLKKNLKVKWTVSEVKLIIYMYMCTCVYMCIYIYIYIHTYIKLCKLFNRFLF